MFRGERGRGGIYTPPNEFAATSLARQGRSLDQESAILGEVCAWKLEGGSMRRLAAYSLM